MTADITKILLAVRQGPSTDSPAVRRVIGLARRGRLEVELLDSAYEPSLEGYLGHDEIYEPLRRRLLAQRVEALQGLTARLQAEGLRCSPRAQWGRPEDTVPERAREGGAGLVVVDGGSPQADLAHRDWQLIARSPVPVLVVRSDGSRPWRTIAAAVDPYRAHGKPRDLDVEILRAARVMLKLSAASLKVVHCFTPVSLFAPDSALDGATLDSAEKAVEAARLEALNSLVTHAGLPAESAVLARGKPADVLCEMASGGAADLLVLGTVSRGRIGHLLVGSTAERVLKHGPGDVLLAPPP
ncbi:MAG: universal stress protein [Gammaproteobacteria bacterium]|nr:universal stress protein [Gammaproteobacteria bacterium]